MNVNSEFVLCWATAAWLYSSNDVWTQVGWAKGSFDNTTFTSTAVYTEDAYYNNAYPYQHYDAIHWGYSPFTIGQYYGFRARGYWGGGTTYGIIADIFWSGAWQEMTASLNLYCFCSDSGTAKYCSNGQEAEVCIFS